MADAPVFDSAGVQIDPKIVDDYQRMFAEMDMADLWPTVLEYIRADLNADQIWAKLESTPEYERRFPAAKAYQAKTGEKISPTRYVELERTYRDLFQQAGLPKGFYDDRSDFTALIGNATAPLEAQSRVAAASRAAKMTDPNYKRALNEMYGLDESDIVAYFLDPERTADLVQRNLDAAAIRGSATTWGMNVSVEKAENAAGLGVGWQQAEASIRQASIDAPTAGKLGAIYGESLTGDDLVDEALGTGNAGATRSKKKKLASQERAAFSGGSGIAQGSLSQKKQAI